MALAVVDLVARLAVPASLAALMWGYGDLAVLAAATVSLLSVVSGLIAGRTTELVLGRAWRNLVEATCRRSAAALQIREAAHQPTPLMDAIARVTYFEAVQLPQAISYAAGLAILAGVVLWRLGAAWLLLGGAAVLVVAPIGWLAHRKHKHHQQVSFAAFAEAAHDFAVLIEGATELRAHGVEERHRAGLLEHVRQMARAERQARTLSALTGLLPLGIALFAVAAPLRMTVEDLAARWAPGRMAEVVLLGATSLVLALGLLRALEAMVAVGAHRRAFASFLADPGEGRADGEVEVALRDGTIALDRVRVRYPGAQDDTPASVTLRWPAGRGLALLGANGSGKTTLASCLIGLQRPTTGRITVADRDAADLAWTRLRKRIVYVPQRGFFSGDRSIGWHLRLLSPGELSDVELEQALERVGLTGVLARHGRGESPLSVPASELSGGERQRMHLARTLLGAPELVVLDEPEVGLDPAGRRWLRELVAKLAEHSRVLLIAHDPDVVPAEFLRLECKRAG